MFHRIALYPKIKGGQRGGRMARPMHKLSAATVKAATPGKYADGSGLWLHKREGGGGQWFLRVTVHGRRREMGLADLRGRRSEWQVCPLFIPTLVSG